jgi:hypothetical protein
MTLSSTPPPAPPPARAPRAGEAGVGRPGGLLVAAFTATIVFGIGQILLPSHEPESPAPAPVSPPPTPPAPAPIQSANDGPVVHPDGGAPTPAADAAAVAEAIRDDAAVARSGRIAADAAVTVAVPARPDHTRIRASEPAEAASPAPTSRKPSEGDADERPADKDLAREAWRHNLPDVSSEGGKSSILIPLKGSIAGASFRVTNRPHAVIVTLPKAASLITMRVYRVGRDGFRLLWINQAEKDADPKDGTSLKLGLSDLGDPLVEIKDDFVRVTVHRQSEAPAPDHAPAPQHTSSSKPSPPHDSSPAPEHGTATKAAPAHDGAAAPERAAPAERAPAPKTPAHPDAS